ncbi:MAG: signal peptidase I [Eubacterium sp.]|nr:signal peptidase I [Eubacterium sp.]
MKYRRNVVEIKFNKEKDTPEKKKPFLIRAFNLFIFMFMAAVMGYIFVTFFFQTVSIIGSSMENTLSNGDTVVMNKIEYSFKKIKTGDIVAIKTKNSVYYDVKRVAAGPGDTIEIIGGKLIVNGQKVDLDIYKEGFVYSGLAEKQISLKNKEYFVLGDNTKNSIDSRYSNVGIIQETDIKGKIILKRNEDGKFDKVE